MKQNWGYESRFGVVISNQPYWNFHGFLSAWGDLLSFSVPGGQKELLGCCLLGGISTQADTNLFSRVYYSLQNKVIQEV